MPTFSAYHVSQMAKACQLMILANDHFPQARKKEKKNYLSMALENFTFCKGSRDVYCQL